MSEPDLLNQHRRQAILARVRDAIAGLPERCDPGRDPRRSETPRPPVDPDLVRTFSENIERFATTVALLDNHDAIPRHLADRLGPSEGKTIPLVLGNDTRLAQLPWHLAPELDPQVRLAEADDAQGLSYAFCAIAESGSLVLLSGRANPTRSNFLVDRHFVILRAAEIVPHPEDAWRRIRQSSSVPLLPRAVNFISGPSSTGDVDLTLQVGAHGPRTLHVLVIL